MKTLFNEGKYTILIVVAAVLLASILLVRLLSGRTDETPTATKEPISTPTAVTESSATGTPAQETPEKGNLMAWADEEADAEEIASLYGITLLSYTEHIAVYWTDQDPAKVIQTGKDNGWPELSKINKVKAFES